MEIPITSNYYYKFPALIKGNLFARIVLVAVVYYLSAHLNIFMPYVTIYNVFPPYWPPPGFTLGLIMILGPSIWPGIVIASLFLSVNEAWLVADQNVHNITIALFYATGRVLEVFAGYYLLKKWSSGNYLGAVKEVFIFILVALLISPIGSGLSSFSIDYFMLDFDFRLFLTHWFSWYADNVIGILLFAPLIYAFAELKNKKEVEQNIIQIIWISLAWGSVFLLLDELSLRHHLFINSLPFLTLATLFWIALQFPGTITTLSVILVSLIAAYYTSNDLGLFAVMGNQYDARLLLQSYLAVASVSTLLLNASGKEQKRSLQLIAEQKEELETSNQLLNNHVKKQGTLITNLKEAHKKAEESDRLKSSFLSNMSHEIRTPMNAIMGFSELLERPLSEEKRKSFTGLLRQRSSDLLSIVNNVLDISKIEAGQEISVPVKGNMEEFLSQLKTNLQADISYLYKKNIEVRLYNQLRGKENDLLVDYKHLQQVLNNLLTNARKFTNEGFIEFGCTKQDSTTLLFNVRDSGVGIAKDKQEVIFKAFRQADETIHQVYGGSGLGLAICKGLIDLWGGKIWVESEEGKGTVFYFTVPYIQDSTSHTATPKHEAETPFFWPDKSILIVEDDPSSARYLLELLSDSKTSIIHVSSGKAALEILTDETSVDLVLLDIGLPDISGYDVLTHLKKLKSTIPVIIISAFAQPETKIKFEQLGCDAFLTKPVNPKDFFQAVSLIFNK